MKQKILILITFNHLVSLFGLLYSSPKWLLLSFIGWILVGKIGGEIGLHRYICHKSFETGKLRHYLISFLSVFNSIGSPVSWSLIHRTHHLKSDTKEDPHGAMPILNIWTTNWRVSNLSPKFIKDIISDPFFKFLHYNYFKIYLLTWVLLFIFSWKIPIFLISLPSVITFHSAALVNILCHKFGYKNYNLPNSSTNNLLVNFLTLGSGLHNNHHANPKNYNNKVKWYELDLPGFFIKKFLLTKPSTQEF